MENITKTDVITKIFEKTKELLNPIWPNEVNPQVSYILNYLYQMVYYLRSEEEVKKFEEYWTDVPFQVLLGSGASTDDWHCRTTMINDHLKKNFTEEDKQVKVINVIFFYEKQFPKLYQDAKKEAYNEAIRGSSLKILKEGDLPYFCVNVNTKAREEIFYDATKGEIVLYGGKKIPYTTMDELLLHLESCHSIIVPKALMLSYQRLLHGNIILPKKGSEYVFFLHTFYERIQEAGIAPEINKLLMVEFDFFKELGNLDTLKIPLKLTELLGFPILDETISLSKDSYMEVSGHEFYERYREKYDEMNAMMSILKNNRGNIIEQMRIVGFNQIDQYEYLIKIAEDILQRIRDVSINGKVDPGLLQEKNTISKNILGIKKSFYSCLLQTVMDCKYIEKLSKNSFRPYVLWLLAINPDLINKLVNNAKIDIFDIENNCYQNER